MRARKMNLRLTFAWSANIFCLVSGAAGSGLGVFGCPSGSMRRLASFAECQTAPPPVRGRGFAFLGLVLALGSFYPKPGHVLICDFERGFVAPEMVKARPVVVVSKSELPSRRLCTVVPLSTTAPHDEFDWHVLLAQNPLPETLGYKPIWAKCDMVYSVSFDRLDKPHRKTRGKREYFTTKLSPPDLDAIIRGIIAHLASMAG